MTHHRRKCMSMPFSPPEWQPHCVPHVFDVSLNARQSMMLDWGWRACGHLVPSRPAVVSAPLEPQKSMVILRNLVMLMILICSSTWQLSFFM